MVNKVERAFSQLNILIETQVLKHQECERIIAEEHHQSKQQLKHDVQESSIIGHLENLQLLSSPDTTTFVEFGAGKGKLSHIVQQVAKAQKMILVDRQRCFKNKADRFQENKQSFIRLGIDIKDFNLVCTFF